MNANQTSPTNPTNSTNQTNAAKVRARGFARVELLIGLGVLAAIVVAVVAVTRMDPRGERAERTGKSYVEDARAAAARDRSKLGWDELAAPTAVPMQRPQGLAVDAEGRLWVAGDRLIAFSAPDATGAAAVELRSDPFEQDYAAVAVGADGRVYAAAETRVDVFALKDATLGLAESRRFDGEQVRFSSVVISEHGIFVADTWGTRVLRLPLEGDGFEVFADGLFVPSTLDIALDPEDVLVTVDPGRHSVQTRDGYGDVLRSFGKEGPDLADFHGCCNPAAIARFADGRTLAAEKGLAATRVKVYGTDGKLENLVANLDAFDARPDGPAIVLDVAVDSQGRVLVLDPARRQVRTFVPKQPEAGK